LCIKCKSPINLEENNLMCSKCFHKYPIVDGVGVLVSDPTKHLKFIQDKIEIKKEWYIGNQTLSYDTGPYKVHLQKRISYVQNVIETYLKNNGIKKNILDLGCGDGANLRWLSKYSQDIWATDYNLFRLRRAKKITDEMKISAKFFLVDILNLPFENNSFDIIFFNHVIEHINNDLFALENIYRITKKGGIVIVGTPNEGALMWKFAYAIEPRVKKKTDHVNFYTSKSLSNLVLKAGFKIKHIEYMGWGIPSWSLDRIIRKYKIIDDIFEHIGKRVFKNQATSLYMILEK